MAQWASGPDDGYFLQNLAYHLARAEQYDELNALLVDFAWLDRKLRTCGISELQADYTYLARPPDVDVTHAALQLSAHVLATDPDQLSGQLVGRLLRQPEPTVRALLDAARAWHRRAWLCPLTPASLTEPGGPLERILQGDHTIKAMAVTADGQRIVSCGDDNTVRVWDLASGRLERTLEGPTGGVRAVAVTADGQRIVSGGGDGTVRVWDLASGTEVARWVTDATRVSSCAAHPCDPTTLIYGGHDGRVVVLLLQGCW